MLLALPQTLVAVLPLLVEIKTSSRDLLAEGTPSAEQDYSSKCGGVEGGIDTDEEEAP